jgi:hypothetical protein
MRPILDVDHTFQVNRSRDEVFDHVAGRFFTNHSRWDPAVLRMVPMSPGPIELGSTATEVRRYGLWTSSAPVTIDLFEPTTDFGYRSTDGPVLETVRFGLRSTEPGTSVTVSLAFVANSMLTRLMAPILGRFIARNVGANLDRIKDAIEADGFGSTAGVATGAVRSINGPPRTMPGR